MSRAITVWLDEETERALGLLLSAGRDESEAIRKAIVEAATHTNPRNKVNDPDALEQALDRSHELVAELLTQRPPR